MKLKTGKLNRRGLVVAAGVLILVAAVVFAIVKWPSAEETGTPQVSYVEIEGAIGTVRFRPSATAPGDYDALRAACDASRITAEEIGGAASGQTVIVSEDTFIDSGLTEAPEETVSYVESETVYFEGTVLIHYASHTGDHVTFAAQYNAEGIPEVLSVDGLVLEGFARVQETEKTVPEAGVSMESVQFLDAVNKCVAPLLTGAELPDYVGQLFTEGGRSALARVGQYAGADEDSEVRIVLSAVGSTDAEKMLANRILLRCRLTAEGRAAVLDLLLKLNDNLIVYDVDLM